VKPRAPLALVVLLLVVGVHTGQARAHALGVSHGVYRLGPDGAGARLTFDASELGAAVDRAALEQRILSQLRVRRGGQRCAAQLLGVELGPAAPAEAPGSSVSLDVRLACSGPGAIDIELGFWGELRPGHRHLASAAGGARVTQAVMFERAPRFELLGAPAAPQPDAGAPLAPSGFTAWLRYGVEHILGGHDHLLFLLSLLLVASDLRALFAIVSTFTLAHSASLALAATGACRVPPSVVEPLIALSICWAAVDNLRARRRPARRAAVFAFGLIHGFGFAGALRELRLDALSDLPALLAFNLGVELGQLAVAAVAFPLLRWLARYGAWQRRAVPALSGAIALVGALWLVERVVEASTATANAGALPDGRNHR